MSIKVMTWVWDNSPTKGTELLMLLAIADNAADDGANAFPSVSTLARKTRLDERTVQRILRKLSDQGQLHIDKRGGREANRYTVLMGQQSAPPANCHPRQNATGGTAAAPGVAQLRHPTPGTAAPPEPPGTVLEPSPAPHAAEVARKEEESTDIDAVLDGLGQSWPLTPQQRKRIAPKVVQALAAGWSAQRLTHYLGANPEGVKSPAAVLAARLDDLPEAVAEEPTSHRPDWCGNCDEPSRTVERTDGRWSRCPQCHPGNADRDSGRPKPPSTHRPEPSTPTDQETGRSTSSVSHGQ
ncbi:helix-turn-helix domain-containing protein [Actinopolyspora saharensis]|uniref:Helix-turn-helix domain-containing protein n=1 Tax=Actinopolyspora saharensis TaxID=995062 RepID=A0A1H1DMR6_9ACTN|nr:helix-turn-helix domain-containing protein [Actinopolyspora saharensis]SDQ77824.1 Helix-turn-helix domain-containing protein [Actinopolyspora saharensis]